MTREQLEGRRARLVRELAESAGIEPASAERRIRLERDLAETARLLAAHAESPGAGPGADMPRHPD